MNCGKNFVCLKPDLRRAFSQCGFLPNKASLTRTIQAREKDGRVSEKWAIHLARALKVELVDLVNSAVNQNADKRVMRRPLLDGITGKKMDIALTETKQIETSDGKMYFCWVINTQTKALVGFSLHQRPDRDLSGPAFKMAVGQMQGERPAMMRVDRGIHP